MWSSFRVGRQQTANIGVVGCIVTYPVAGANASSCHKSLSHSSDLMKTQMEVTFSPLKRSGIKHPSLGHWGLNLVVTFFDDTLGIIGLSHLPSNSIPVTTRMTWNNFRIPGSQPKNPQETTSNFSPGHKRFRPVQNGRGHGFWAFFVPPGVPEGPFGIKKTWKKIGSLLPL